MNTHKYNGEDSAGLLTSLGVHAFSVTEEGDEITVILPSDEHTKFQEIFPGTEIVTGETASTTTLSKADFEWRLAKALNPEPAIQAQEGTWRGSLCKSDSKVTR